MKNEKNQQSHFQNWIIFVAFDLRKKPWHVVALWRVLNNNRAPVSPEHKRKRGGAVRLHLPPFSAQRCHQLKDFPSFVDAVHDVLESTLLCCSFLCRFSPFPLVWHGKKLHLYNVGGNLICCNLWGQPTYLQTNHNSCVLNGTLFSLQTLRLAIIFFTNYVILLTFLFCDFEPKSCLFGLFFFVLPNGVKYSNKLCVYSCQQFL